MKKVFLVIFLIIIVALLYGVFQLRFLFFPQPTEIVSEGNGGVSTAAEGIAPGGQQTGQQQGIAQLTPIPLPTPTLGPPPTPTALLANLSMATGDPNALPRHGILISFLLPLVLCGLPWIFLEGMLIRHVQPKSFDISTVEVKSGDGLFIKATISMTARKTLAPASFRESWSRARQFVEKEVEQELLHEAVNFPTLDDLERNLKDITERFLELPVVHELARDFGIEVMRFNVELDYPSETMDALKRKANASAGGIAYLAYASAAHLDPESEESRELYRIYQQTTSQVDAARNFGGGITELASLLGYRISKRDTEEELEDDGQKDKKKKSGSNK